MQLARALAVPVTVALAGSMTGVVSSAATAESTVVTISDRPDPAIYHDRIGPATADVVQHRGRLTTAGGEPIADATVTLLRQLAGGKWVESNETVTTNAEGRYLFDSYAEGNADYQVRYDGDALVHEPAHSAVEPLEVMRDFNAEVVERPGRAVLKGNLNPGWKNKVVRWEHKKCRRCSWRVIDRAKSGDTGGWRFEGRYPPVDKRWFYRAAVAGTERFTDSVSATLVTTTTPAKRISARTTVR